MSIDLLYRVKIDLEERINAIPNEETKARVLSEIAEAQGYTNPDITRIPISECRVRQGWIVHRSRVRDKAHARAFRDYLVARLTQIGAPSNEIVLMWAGWEGENAGLPIHKERYSVTDPKTMETTYHTRVRKNEDGTDEEVEFPLDSDLQNFFFYPEREVDDGEGGTITLPATQDVNRIGDTPRAYSEA